ncbi:methyltransferase domain-containing protein [Colwellia sp. MSW7]|uniref:Methyltransferase domain-containing protein n=1 Tax=Colwellia maritima TaxID=2912588 RepID=A0ABS9X1R0_9GAMM|nr:methyltransferase domain-containing protein [Colwellia maritima]MCI2284109.1 methyltransferase domain-containing protein [Colwellia maritima]
MSGCGEGFYTHQYKTSTNKVYGVDIAKETIKIAAKRYQQCHFSVGTLSKLSFADSYFGWIVSVYAPILETEFTRLLAKDGFLLTVTPLEQHLFELKTLIYKQANEHDTSKKPIEKLTLVEEKRLTYHMHFNGSDDVLNLLAMTPFAFKASQALIKQISSMTTFTCQADFVLRLYQK